jgi:hypothetical protein
MFNKPILPQRKIDRCFQQMDNHQTRREAHRLVCLDIKPEFLGVLEATRHLKTRHQKTRHLKTRHQKTRHQKTRHKKTRHKERSHKKTEHTKTRHKRHGKT